MTTEITTSQTSTDLALVETWASRVRKHLRKGIESFIKAGRDLDAAVEDFKNQGNKHWQHAYSELLAELQISQQTAHTLRTISQNPILSDPANYGSLPGSWTTLGELASLPQPELEKLIEAGEVTPELKREQVRWWKCQSHTPASGSTRTVNIEVRTEPLFKPLPKLETRTETTRLSSVGYYVEPETQENEPPLGKLYAPPIGKLYAPPIGKLYAPPIHSKKQVKGLTVEDICDQLDQLVSTCGADVVRQACEAWLARQFPAEGD